MFAICHTHYSLQTGVGSPKEWAEAAAARGYTALAIADVDGLYGAVEFAQAAATAGLHPIVGATVTLDRDSHCLVLAPDERAYRQLCRLLTVRHGSPDFSVAQIAGDIDALLFLARQGGVLQRLAQFVSPHRLYALAPLASTTRQPLLWDLPPHGCRVVHVPESWFLQEEDRLPFAYLRILRTHTKGNDSLTADHPGAVLPEAQLWRQQYPDQATADEIVEQCQFRFPFGAVHLPRISLPQQMDAAEHLQALCRQGLAARYPQARRQEAEARLERELRAIIASGYADYFLYVREITDFARRKGIPVGVRGSAASSLVSHVLGFTECCPLANDLYFERFMNPGRRDCPDIDLDIADVHRDQVIRYCYEHWGKERVAMASTIQFYRAHGALRDAGRILKLSPERISALVDSPHGDRECPELYRIGALLAGRPRHLGVHCGGLFVTPDPITDYTPLAVAPKGIRITHFEKDQAAAVGLVKMDLLGNSALSVIDEARRFVAAAGREFGEPGPALDFKVSRMFARGDTLGVYQCESPGMRQLCSAIRPTNPKEVAATLSLIRPGPAAAGMKDAFVRRRRGLEAVDYIHPRMADFLGDTYGVMLYQEDVMKVAVNLAGYSLADADVLRRVVSKARSSQTFANERGRFVFQKAAAAGIPEETASKIWERVSRFAAYSYCRAHATVYARLAWLMARLKAHHPREFFAASLNHHKSMYPARVFVWDALRHGIPVYAPDVALSEVDWQPFARGVRAGLGLIRGLSRNTSLALLSARQKEPFPNLAELVRRVPFRPGEAERLILVGACQGWGSRTDLLAELQELSPAGRQPMLFSGRVHGLVPLLRAQLVLTGIPFCMHPVEAIRRHGYCLASDMGRHLGSQVTMVGILDATKHLRTQPKQGEAADMSFVTFEDASGLYDAILFPDAHVKFSRLFTYIGPFELKGRIVRQWDSCSLELTAASPLDLPA